MQNVEFHQTLKVEDAAVKVREPRCSLRNQIIDAHGEAVSNVIEKSLCP